MGRGNAEVPILVVMRVVEVNVVALVSVDTTLNALFFVSDGHYLPPRVIVDFHILTYGFECVLNELNGLFLVVVVTLPKEKPRRFG